jgi:uncharacterized protein
MADCPICRRNAAPRKENPAFPFCSTRCKTVDMGRWLDEGYRVPVAPDEVEDEGDAHAVHSKVEDA